MRQSKLMVAALLLVIGCVTIARAQSSNDLPTPFDIVMLAGADYTLTIKHTDATGAPIDITGDNYYAQFRSAPAPGGILFATYSTSIFVAGNGWSTVRLSRYQTLKLSGKTGVWDLLRVDSAGRSTYLLGGKASVKPTATRWP